MKKIAIIKLGAKGDVIRTLPIAKAIKEKNPDSEISWIVKDSNKELIQNEQFIDKVFPLPFEATEEFDILYNFDIEKDATDLATKIKSKEKYGFYEEQGFATAFNLGAEYYLNTLFDDKTKKTNTKTYQEMMFMAAELSPNKDLTEINIQEKDKKYAENFLKNNRISTEKLIGIHLGASSRWPSKVWHKENLKEFIKKAKEKSYEVILFAGPNEAQDQNNLLNELKEENTQAYQNEPNNTDGQFAALVNSCKMMICSDSFALHVSVFLKKPTIGLFFCTSPNEVESYGLLTKVVSPMLPDFFPEKMNQYSESLVKSISADDVMSRLNA